MEILRDHPDPIHAIFCCVGGGGLIAGIAAYVKRLRPEIKIIGVEAVDADAMTQSLAAGKRITLEQVGLFADGAAVKQVGVETFRLCQEYVDEMILVDNDAICAAIKDVFEDTRSILEPAGALAVAGVKAYVKQHKLHGKTLIAIGSGANMNFDRLALRRRTRRARRAARGLAGRDDSRTTGRLQEILQPAGNRNITEFNYRFADAKQAHIFVGVTTHQQGESQRLVEMLGRHQLPALDLTDNEMGKLHLRHLVGGHAPQVKNEQVYRFEFPERPGALMNFLEHMSADWNISLFHYRNHGADYGRVLGGDTGAAGGKTGLQDLPGQAGLCLVG